MLQLRRNRSCICAIVNIIVEHRRKRSRVEQGQAAAIMHGSSNSSKHHDQNVITSKRTSPSRSNEDIRRRSSLLMQAALTAAHSSSGEEANHDSTCQHTPPLSVTWPSTALARLKSQQPHDGCVVSSIGSPYTSLADIDEEDDYEGRDPAPAASGEDNDEYSQCDELLTMLKEADDQLYLDIMWNIHKVELDW